MSRVYERVALLGETLMPPAMRLPRRFRLLGALLLSLRGEDLQPDRFAGRGVDDRAGDVLLGTAGGAVPKRSGPAACHRRPGHTAHREVGPVDLDLGDFATGLIQP